MRTSGSDMSMQFGSQLAVKFKAGGPECVILSLLSKLGHEHQEWVEKASGIVLNHGEKSTQSYQECT